MARVIDRIREDLIDRAMSMDELENYMASEQFHLKEADEENATDDLIKFTNYSSEAWIEGYISDGEIYITGITPVTRPESEQTKVDPFHCYEDLEKVQNYFWEKDMFHHWLAGWLMVAEGRRIGDTMRLKWDDFFTTKMTYRKKLIQLKEEKTGKKVAPVINAIAQNALNEYIKIENINVKKVYHEPIFKCDSAAFRKALKKAVEMTGIEYPVSTHSYRKFFGNTLYKLHPQDANNLKIIQFMFGHSSEQTTKVYIGQLDEEIDKYNLDFADYILAKQKGEDFEISNSPVISLKTENFRELLSLCWDYAKERDDKFEAINEIIGLAEQLML